MFKRIFALVLALAFIMCCPVLSEEEEVVFDDKLTVLALPGEASTFILALESALYEKGYLDELYVDGYFDDATTYAIMDFQLFRGYEPDGLITKVQFYWLNRKYYKDWFDTSDIVYITETGTRYHVWECSSLENSVGIMPISANVALELGYMPCRLCKPLGYN